MKTFSSTPVPRSPHSASAAAGQRGATLIEVLVAVVLLSFGIVGLAGLQMNGTKFSHNAYQRSQATALAYDMADRIRSNLDVCRTGQACAYNTALGTLFDGNGAQACRQTLDVAPPGPATLAAADVNQWKSCLEEFLPNGRGAVLVANAANGGGLYTDACGVEHGGNGSIVIEVNWTEGRFGLAQAFDCVVVRTEARPL